MIKAGTRHPGSGTRIEVAVGILQCADGKILVNERQANKSLAGYLEFPGGKIEPGETPLAALRRELHEELGISADETYLRPLIRCEYDYPEFSVRLYAYRLQNWDGEPAGQEDQRLSWQTPENLLEAPFLPASRPILNALVLPSTLLITPQPEPGETDAFRQCFEQALSGDRPGGALLRLRDRALLELLATPLVTVANKRQRPLILNAGQVVPRLPKGFSGLHLPAAVLSTLDARPGVDGWVGASVHHIEEAVHARRLGLDYIIAGNVRETPSHPDNRPLDWSGFEKIAVAAGIPTYAIGGMTLADLAMVQACWGQGVAAIRAFWPNVV